MNSVLTLEIAVSIRSLYEDSCALDARFFSVEPIYELDIEAVLLTIARIHSVEHECPVLRLCAARTGMEGKNGIVSVIFAREERIYAHFFLAGFYFLYLGKHLVTNALIIFLYAHFCEHECIRNRGAKLFICLYLILCALQLLKHLARVCLIIPEILGKCLCLECFCLLAQSFYLQRIAELLYITLKCEKFAFRFF